MAVGTQATNLNGWFGGRCGLLMFLCNKSPSKDFFLDDFCRSLLPLSVPLEPLEKVRQPSPFACFLLAPLYTKSGMVSSRSHASSSAPVRCWGPFCSECSGGCGT